MVNKLNACKIFDGKRSNPTVTEEGKSFRLVNNSKVIVTCFEINGCVFKNESTKCDYKNIIL